MLIDRDFTIELTGMEFHAFHGCLESERKEGNTFVVDFRGKMDAKKAAKTDDLSKTADYSKIYEIVAAEMAKLGYRTYIDAEHQGPIITTFFYPERCGYTFREMYDYIKARGYAIYPGKVTEAETFRIGTIGEIYREDIEKLIGIYKEFLAERQ